MQRRRHIISRAGPGGALVLGEREAGGAAQPVLWFPSAGELRCGGCTHEASAPGDFAPACGATARAAEGGTMGIGAEGGRAAVDPEAAEMSAPERTDTAQGAGGSAEAEAAGGDAASGAAACGGAAGRGSAAEAWSGSVTAGWS